jgi:hypothetical protein
LSLSSRWRVFRSDRHQVTVLSKARLILLDAFQIYHVSILESILFSCRDDQGLWSLRISRRRQRRQGS